MPGHLLPDPASQGRRSIILERMRKITELGSGEKGDALKNRKKIKI
ncbi:hypothetical protein D1AOALGA4SA_5922 [Olavius algarvensis Delta 1 endosymbiont]|nr:hypothetical protein D1AOALGA4SA_5922 [Olavius algarvensis Delta 1 endosymbiont]